MSPPVAQILLTVIFLTAAVVFILLDHDQLSIGLVGAVLGQGTAVAVQKVANGNGGKG